MKKKNELKPDEKSCRLSKVGGQAVLEGVMMKAGDRTVTTCRLEDGSLSVTDNSFTSVRKKHKILNIPILRGVINMVEMLMLSFKTLSVSAEALGIEEEEGKFERWLKKHFGASITDFVMVVGMVLGVALSIFLFMFLPVLAADLVDYLLKTFADVTLGIWEKVIEGVMKAAIFVAYLALVSLMPDIRRTFMYHGAEHKTIACFEAGEELTPENAMKHKRFHPRCGTSFMFVMILLGILAGVAVHLIAPELGKWAYMGIKLLILPLVIGVGYEFIMFAGKHDNVVTRVLSAPGLWVQRLTTKEPTPDMLEVAITSTKCALRDEFPEYMEFYKSRAWEREKPSDDEEEGAAEGKSDMDACESGNTDVNADLREDNTDNGAPAIAGADADIINSGNEDGAQ